MSQRPELERTRHHGPPDEWPIAVNNPNRAFRGSTLGQQGLPVNDPTRTFPLRSLAGEYSALNLVCLLHVGIKQFDPSQGSGFDIDREYEADLALYRDQGTATAA